MAYSRKFAGLFGTIGYDRTVDCTTETSEAILTKIMAAYADRDALKAQVAASLARGRAKLGAYEDALRGVLAGR